VLLVEAFSISPAGTESRNYRFAAEATLTKKITQGNKYKESNDVRRRK
jgi:hypothetical protein